MDKSNYETYEYPLANASESDHFFVVQDNGTFLVQHIKETLETAEPCAVYDVAPQFLVDVDNAAELITVSDQYITDAQSNLFTNSYLLQPGTARVVEPMEHEVSEPLDEVSENKAAGSCTEITLSDEQYQMLEQKGWLLLEIGDKIYVLNTLGLHDITTNDKLIEKLKNESQSNIVSSSQDVDIGTFNLENNTSEVKDFSQTLSGPVEPTKRISNDIKVDDTSLDDDSILMNSIHGNEAKLNFLEPSILNKETLNNSETQDEDVEANTRVLVIENEDIKREGNTLKVKTKLSLKDFPDKIVLGKTLNGKRLVANVVKQNPSEDAKALNSNQDKPEDNTETMPISLSAPNSSRNDSNLPESEFCILLQHLFRNNVNKNKCTSDDIVTADSVITQLLQIPVFKPSVIEHNLIITKVLQKLDVNGKTLSKVLASVVTGKVSQISGQWRFIHLPHMLQNMVLDTEELIAKYEKGEIPYNYIIKEDYVILHVQISEVKEATTNAVRLTVTVNKKNIYAQQFTNGQQSRPNKMYACSACAAVFDVEWELKDHQADHSLEAEDMLTIDMDQPSKTTDLYFVKESGKSKNYTCMQCNATFNRLQSCKNHIKTHFKPENNEKKAIYKCNMCTCTYSHPSTLSKHILSRHINKVALLSDNYLQS